MDVDEFLAGLRVLAVDDDRVSLMLIAKQLRLCKYNVTTAMDPELALEMLRARRDADDQFDIVITDVHMPGMDGFMLLEHIGLELDIPVIMLSANDTFETMVKGIQHGARDYLVKPVRMEQLKQLWKHAVRKVSDDPSNGSNNNSNGSDEGHQSENGANNNNQTNTTKTCSTKKKKHGDIAREDGDKDKASARKKQRIQWSGALHRKFVKVVDQLGLNKAVPKKILEMMNVDGLTREHVASHLQKYRMYLKKLSDGTYRSSSPFTDEASWGEGNSTNANGQEHFEHNLENGKYKLSLPFAGSSSSSNPFARMNSPAAFGTHSLLPTQSVQLMTQRNSVIPFKDMGPVGYGGNTPQVAVPGSQQVPSTFTSAGSFNTNICFPSVTNISNGMPFNTSNPFPSGTSSNSFANIPNGSSQSDPFKTYASLLRGSVENIADSEMLPPSSNNLPMQHLESAAPFGLNGSINSGKTAVPFGLMVATSEADPSQGNRRMINRLSRFAASSGQRSEFQNQLASLARAATPMAAFSNEQVAPLFNMGNTSAMMNGSSAPGGTSSVVSTLPNLEMNNTVMLNQTLNGGGEGDNLPERGGIVDQQQAIGDQLNNNDESLAATSAAQNGADNALDDFFADWLNQGVLRNDDTFMGEDWRFTP